MTQLLTQKKSEFPLFSFFGFTALLAFIARVILTYAGFTIWNMLFWIAFFSISILSFVKPAKISIPIGLGCVVLISFVWVVESFGWLMNDIDKLINDFYLAYLVDLFFYIDWSSMFLLIAGALLLIQSLGMLMKGKLGVFQKLWFLPACCYEIGVLIWNIDMLRYGVRQILHPAYLLMILEDILLFLFFLFMGKWIANVAANKAMMEEDSIPQEKIQPDFQPVVQSAAQPVFAQPVYAQPVQQPVSQPVAQPVYTQPAPQPAAPAVAEKTVQMASAVGFVPPAQPKVEEDELVKYKRFYEEGLITLEEYNAKKKQVLGL